MDLLRRYMPLFIKIHIRKWKWIFCHYKSIDLKSKLELADSHFLGPITYNTDSLVTSNNADFIKAPRFAAAYAAAAATNPWEGFTLQWRVYVVCWFANQAKHLEGDFVECGVNTGAYARAVVEYTNFNTTGKVFYLLDTFGGLVEDLVSEEEKNSGIAQYFGTYQNVYDQVKATFKDFNVKIIKGPVPDTLSLVGAERIAYLSIDMNCVAPEIAAINFFWDKLVPGAVVILDDYGFPMHIHQKIAFDEFAQNKGIEILSLPTGQGIIIKP